MLMPQPIDVPSLQFITSANALLLYPNGMNWFLASQDALEVMSVTDSVSQWVSFGTDFTVVTLVSDDTYRRLNWSDPDDPDDPDESYLVMKVI